MLAEVEDMKYRRSLLKLSTAKQCAQCFAVNPADPRSILFGAIAFLVCAFQFAAARDIHVDPGLGRDIPEDPSAAYRTIAAAIRIAKPGDTIHLKPGRYSQSADFFAKNGESGNPIVLDGHGAILDGSEPVLADQWESLGGGLFRKVKLMPKLDKAMLGRWFFIWNGKMNLMGRTSKGPSTPLKAVADLNENEWTYVEAEDAFYLRVPEGTGLDAAGIRYPARPNGVAMGGSGSFILVRNVVATNVYNDGYNIHGAQRGLVFENIAAIDCGDDGFSAHEDAECRVDGFVSIGNSTGICDTVSSVTHYRNVYIRDCHAFDVYFIGDSLHSMENVLVESTAFRTLEVSQHGDRPQHGPSAVHLKNAVFRRVSGNAGEARFSRNALVSLEQCSFYGVNLTALSGSACRVQDCGLFGAPLPNLVIQRDAAWKGERNCYELGTLRFGDATFGEHSFADFCRAVEGEVGSRWGRGLGAVQCGGADDAAMQELPKKLGVSKHRGF